MDNLDLLKEIYMDFYKKYAEDLGKKISKDDIPKMPEVESSIDMSVFDLADRLDLRSKSLSSAEMLDKTMDAIEKMVQSNMGDFSDIEIPKFDSDKPVTEPVKLQKEAEAAVKRDDQSAVASQSEEAEPEPTYEELMEELDNLVGLDTVKEDIRTMMNFIRVCKLRTERGLKAPELSHHMVFSGNPGTGKTTIARLLSKLYKAIGLLEKGQLVEVDRAGLIAGYQGQTAIKTAEVVQSALGGVLFIDEAYSLVQGDNDSYGKECIATVLKAMEDNRDKLVVIVAGYDDLMHKFIESNPGLRSRFNKYIHFPDYTGEEMEKIFLLQCKSNGYQLEEAGQKLLREVFDRMYEMRDENFGNGRTVRNTFEKIINCQATRLAAARGEGLTDDELMKLTVADVRAGLEMNV
ncbi:MAG: AAA family ATPase [Firmicutes bacterium]|nr:AAA family ATPase [Bacillota bacterium]